MKRTILYFTLLTAFAASLAGCVDFLDTVPDNRTEIDDAGKAYKLLVNAYPRKTYAGMLEARCDGMIDFGATLSGGKQAENYEYLRAGFYWMPYVQADCDDSYERFWEDCYRAISYSNFALKALDESGSEWDPAEAKALRAEAKICRAYSHFMLVCLFSNMFQYKEQGVNLGIPYVTEPESQLFSQYDRETVAITLSKIKDDLFSEIDNLPNSSYHDTPEFRFSREAAIAFAVRFCLFTRDWHGVINYANMLLLSPNRYIESGGTKYIDDDDPAFVSITSKLLDWNEYSQTGANLYEPGQFFSDPKNPSYLLTTEVESIVMRANIGRLFTSYAYGRETVSDVATVNVTGKNWALPMLAYGNDETTFWIKFYEDMLLVNEAAGIGYVYLKMNLFRLEEVLLARAEAKAMLGMIENTDYFDKAIDDLNIYIAKKIRNYNYVADRLSRAKIRAHYSGYIGRGEEIWVENQYNMDVFNPENYGSGPEVAANMQVLEMLMLCVMDMRRVEFMYEGMRYFDILRWNIPVTHTRRYDNMSRTMLPTDDMRVLQIPQSTILSGLEPNPMKYNSGAWPGIIY